MVVGIQNTVHLHKPKCVNEVISLAGLELTFYSGVYGTCLGAMTRFGDNAKSLIGLSGIFIGVGEVLGKIVWVFINLYKILSKNNNSFFLLWSGGSLFGMLNQCNKYGRNPVVLLGLVTHFLAFYLIFLNIASDAPLAPEEGTHLQGFITPR